ncbi:MAG TPA: transglutaminase-like domain-containing protein [Candidatus Angelobacter sp.]|jgi:transglutaminase-like putative cysteine protease|nr:transglutaminase-like domain-containing protein [Candidatus Angelobacter sp.]
MTQLGDARVRDVDVDALDGTVAVAVAPRSADGGEVAAAPSMVRTLAAAALSTAAAAWMTGGIFRSGAGRGLGLLGIALAVALTLLGSRLRRPTALQLLVIPAAVVLGALLVLPSTGGSATIPSLVGDALRGGGILQPPIALDPGWRLVLVVLFAGVCSAATTLALSLERPMLAVALPVPVVAVAALVQPPGGELLSVAGAVVLLAAALAIAYGADLSRASSLGLAFERGRLLRGAALAAVLVVAVSGLGRVGVLFPQSDATRVVPPQPPQPQPPGPDRALFAVHFGGGAVLPLRTGVLDVYDSNSQQWLLPSYDTSRMQSVRPPAALPGAPSGGGVHVEVTIRDFPGHVLPAVPGSNRVGGTSDSLRVDSRTGQIELSDQPAFAGLSYTLDAPSLPAAGQLIAAPAPPSAMRDFLAVPAAPPAIAALLARAPADGFDRMQALRKALFAKVVAAGGGAPAPVPPQRVVEMLNGGRANPFEITAAEAMLARWAGVPARIAFGYQPPASGGTYEVHPHDGAAWLEAWFQGYGWLPILGVPPRAQPTFDHSRASSDASIAPSDKLGLVVYVPVQERTSLAPYEVARWWLVRAIPFAALALLLVLAYPMLLKRLRAARRTRWALRRGPAARIAVAYAEFRDAMGDLAVGDPVLTPLRFLGEIEPDDEHAELAWLVTRALWGDLRRDLRASDADAAETLARSVRRRVLRAQSPLSRALAAMARTSLRRPYSDEVPNLWPQIRVARRGRGVARPRGTMLRRRAAAAATLLLVLVAVSALMPPPGATVPTAAHSTSARDDAVLDALVPPAVGPLLLRRQTSVEGAFRNAGSDALVTAGHVYTVHNGDVIEGSVQVSLLRADLDRASADVVDQLRQRLGSGNFTDMVERIPLDDGACACPGRYTEVSVKDETLRFQQRIWVSVQPDQRVYFWFPPQPRTLEVVVLRAQFPPLTADELVLTMSDREHGAPLVALPVPPIAAELPGAAQ